MSTSAFPQAKATKGQIIAVIVAAAAVLMVCCCAVGVVMASDDDEEDGLPTPSPTTVEAAPTPSLPPSPTPSPTASPEPEPEPEPARNRPHRHRHLHHRHPNRSPSPRWTRGSAPAPRPSPTATAPTCGESTRSTTGIATEMATGWSANAENAEEGRPGLCPGAGKDGHGPRSDTQLRQPEQSQTCHTGRPPDTPTGAGPDALPLGGSGLHRLLPAASGCLTQRVCSYDSRRRGHLPWCPPRLGEMPLVRIPSVHVRRWDRRAGRAELASGFVIDSGVTRLAQDLVQRFRQRTVRVRRRIRRGLARRPYGRTPFYVPERLGVLPDEDGMHETEPLLAGAAPALV